MPSIFGIFTSRMAMSGGVLGEGRQGSLAVMVSAHLVAFGFEEHLERSHDVLVVVHGTGKTTIAALLGVGTNARPRHSGRLEPLVRMARMDGYDLLIIDTSSGNLSDVYEAHLLADVILTPMNESPADMHGLFAPLGSAAAPKINYREMVETVRFDRKRAGLPEQRWQVVMNRISALPSKIGNTINDRVAVLAREAGFEQVWRLRDRVVHRAIALEGRTVFDAPTDGKLSMSELSGRQEVRALLAMIDRAPAGMLARAA
jgi:hypothetical protein